MAALDGTNGFRLDGIVSGDNSGFSVDGAGDFNGDGFDDLIIGARWADPGGDGQAGESYVVFGAASGFGSSLDLATLDGTNGFRLEGIDAFDAAGYSVSGAGDVNGDGFDDIIIGARIAAPGGVIQAGESYVVFGAATGFGVSLDLTALDGTNGFQLDGIDIGDRSGVSVAGAGDVNGDGFDDLIIGARYADPGGDFDAGEGYVVFGAASGLGASLDLAALDGTNGFQLDGIDASDQSGFAVSGAGDVNGDGYDDLIIGAFRADAGGDSDAGESYVVFGGASGFGASLDLAALDGANGFRLDGIDASDESGISVSSAGDVNGDGFDDLIVGARRADPGGNSSAGESYVVFGKVSGFGASLDLTALDGTNGFQLDGIDPDDLAGSSVRNAGDVNGDGFDDIIIGARYGDPGGDNNAGESYVVFGAAAGFAASFDLATLDGTNGFRLDGIGPLDQSGFSVSGAGDVNGDGFDDLIIGAFRADPDSDNDAGESYVVFGGNFAGAVTFVGGDGDDTQTGTAAAETFVGGRGNDVMNGGGGADAFRGGAGDDTAVVGAEMPLSVDLGTGIDTVNLDAQGASIALSDLAGSRLVDVEKIDLGGTENNTLALDALSVVNMSSTSNTVLITGDLGDQVLLQGTWIAGAAVVDPQGETGTFLSYSSGAATVLIEDEVAVFTPEPVIDLAALDGTNGFQLEGINPADQSAWSVSGAGDLNGDGFDDLIIGAVGADPGGENEAGESYVVFGAAAGFGANLDLAALDGINGFRLDGIDPDDRSGFSVAGAGDFNGDGFDDLIIGARRGDPGSDNDAGESYVVFGAAAGFGASLDLAALDGTNGFRLDGIDPSDQSGRPVSGAGDVNGDGFDDLIIGAYRGDPGGDMDAGESYVVFGAASGFAASLDLAALDGTNGFQLDGIDNGDLLGLSAAGAGDVNGDGFDDLIIGAPFADPGGDSSAGESYVVFGAASGFGASLDLAALDGTNGFRLDGIDLNDFSGFSVSGAGDVNGDGFDDLIIGARNADPGGDNDAGESYVVFGASSGFGASLDLAALDGTNGFRLDGIDAGDRSGFSVSGAGDINGDGFDDLIIGAYLADPGGNGDAGESYVVYGAASGFGASLDLAALNGTNGFRLDGIDAGGQSGFSVSGAGDVNGDGFDDFIIGARNADPGGDNNAGESYVVFGGNFAGAVTFVGGDGDDTQTGTAAAETFVGGRGNDLMNGGGGADAFRGGAGDDTAVVGAEMPLSVDLGTGLDTVNLDAQGASIALSDLSGSRLVDVEKIDLGGTEINTLTLDALSIVNMSSTSNTVLIKGDAGDLVSLQGSWVAGAAVVDPQGETGTFLSYTSGAAMVLIEDEVAVFTPAIDLAALDGTNGFRLAGIDPSDLSGFSVEGAGDVNGDGFDDIVIGAVFADPSGDSSAGESYVVFGAASGFAASVDLAALDGTNGFGLEGIDASDQSGFSVSGAGDINGDGFDDLIIGANAADSGGDINAGESYVVFGAASGFGASLDLAALDGTNGFQLEGINALDQSGFSVSGAGDVNGDGFDDLIIGALLADPGGDSGAGESYVVFGAASGFGASLDLAALDGTNGFRLDGIDPDDRSGRSVAGAGDINGDGFDDIIIGAYRGNSNAGESYVVFGAASGFAASLDLAALDGTNGFRLDGIDADDRSGWSVAGAGDVNGDGFDDIIIGAYRADPGGDGQAGESYVVFGAASGFGASQDLAALDGTNGFQLDGIDASDFSAFSVSGAGDVNGDGFDDLIIGARFGDPGGDNAAGESYVVFGAASGFGPSLDLAALDGTNGFRLDGIDLNDQSGRSVAGAGDVNGDGFDDLIIGAYQAAPDGDSGAGESYVVFGGNFTASVTLLGTSGSDALGGTSSAEIIIGAQGNDTISSGTGDDLLSGAEGDDHFIFNDGDGNDTIRDFEVGRDEIDITAFTFADFNAVLLASTDVGQDVVITLDGDDSLTLQGINIDDLLESDFLF